MNTLVAATADLPRAQTTSTSKARMPPSSSRSSAASHKKQQPSLPLSIPTTATVAVKIPATNNSRYQFCLPPTVVHLSLSLPDYSPRPQRKLGKSLSSLLSRWQQVLMQHQPLINAEDKIQAMSGGNGEPISLESRSQERPTTMTGTMMTDGEPTKSNTLQQPPTSNESQDGRSSHAP